MKYNHSSHTVMELNLNININTIMTNVTHTTFSYDDNKALPQSATSNNVARLISTVHRFTRDHKKLDKLILDRPK